MYIDLTKNGIIIALEVLRVNCLFTVPSLTPIQTKGCVAMRHVNSYYVFI